MIPRLKEHYDKTIIVNLQNKFKIGDYVKIIESKPFSKNKRWEAINK